MKVSVEAGQGLQRKVKIELLWDALEEKIEAKLAQLQKTAKLKGFRPGKVPLKKIKELYSKAVENEVSMDLMSHSFSDAIEEHNLKLAGMPQFEPGIVEQGQPFEFTATFEIFPEFEVVDLSSVKLQKTVAEVTDADIEKTLEELRQQRTNWEVVDRASKDGDRVKVDFKGFIGDEPLENGSADDSPIVIGSNTMIPGFEEGLIGVTVGQELDLNLTFPKDYHATDIAGKEVLFKIRVNEVAEPKLPDLNDEFATAFGIEGGFDKLKEELKQGMERELNLKTKNELKLAVFDKLVELNEIELPVTMIDREVDNLKKQAEQQRAQYSIQNNVDEQSMDYEAEARRRLTLGLLLSEIVEKHNIQPDAAKVKEIIEQRASAFAEPEMLIKAYYENKRLLEEVEGLTIEEQAIEKLLENANVEEVSKSYEQVMRPEVPESSE